MARNTHYIVIFTFGIWASLSIAPLFIGGI